MNSTNFVLDSANSTYTPIAKHTEPEGKPVIACDFTYLDLLLFIYLLRLITYLFLTSNKFKNVLF